MRLLASGKGCLSKVCDTLRSTWSLFPDAMTLYTLYLKWKKNIHFTSQHRANATTMIG